MCLTLAVPFLQGGLTAYSAKVRRHLSGLETLKDIFPVILQKLNSFPYLGSLKDPLQKSFACKSPWCNPRRKSTWSKRSLWRHWKKFQTLRASLNLGELLQHLLKLRRQRRVKAKAEWLRKEEHCPTSTHPAPGWHAGGKNCTAELMQEDKQPLTKLKFGLQFHIEIVKENYGQQAGLYFIKSSP